MPAIRRLTVCAIVATSLAFFSETRAEFTPIAGFDQQLFPSYLIATATTRPGKQTDPHRLGDPLSLLGVEVKSPGRNAPVKVTVECDDFFETSVYSGTLADAEASYRITPKIKYRYQRLAQCDQAAPTTVTFRVQFDDGPEEEHVVTCTMRSINDCPFAFRRGDEIVDASFAFAAYVNEQHPFVDKLLREALDIGTVTSFTGYQSGKPEEVILQAYALWELLVERDVRYSSITTTAAVSENVYSQHVRLIEDSVNNSQANCVDGSVLWVSMLRKIGINAFLVVTSNHCYAGFFVDREHKICFAIETTLLGAEVDPDDIEIPELFDNAVEEDLRDDASFASFVQAIQIGTAQLHKSQEMEKNGKEADFVVIDIAKMRKQGILPIAFQNSADFVARGITSSDSDAAMPADSQENSGDESEEDDETEN